MRLSHDDDSWRASGIKRRDFRHDHSQPDETRSRQRKPKKYKRDTKTWCRGKVGQPHIWFKEARANLWGAHWRCGVCHMTVWRIPATGEPALDPEAEERAEMEKAFCSVEGHTWEWDEPEFRRIPISKWNVEYYERRGNKIYREEPHPIWGAGTVYYYLQEPEDVGRTCALCGKHDKTTRLPVKDLWRYK